MSKFIKTPPSVKTMFSYFTVGNKNGTALDPHVAVTKFLYPIDSLNLTYFPEFKSKAPTLSFQKRIEFEGTHSFI